MIEGSVGARIVEFCRFARSCGISSGVGESTDALAAVHAVGVTDREPLKFALRSVLCSTKEDWDRFDEIFDAFWGSEAAKARPADRLAQRAELSKATDGSPSAAALLGQAAASSAETEGGRLVLGASAHERLKKTDFSEVSQAEQAELEGLALRLLKQMSMRISRRLKKFARAGEVDLRRTIRLSISHGGDPIDLSFKGRQLEPNRLVILLDISGSMNPYSLFLLRFAYALQRHFKQVHTFLFSTRLCEISQVLRRKQLREAMLALAEQDQGWSGGTRIGESLREFNHVYGRRTLSRSTVFLILSDGWDTGEPELLAEEIRAIKRRTRKLIWLNPLLGMKGYEPVTRGISAALPYIDVFAPAHNLQSLLELEVHLARN